MSEINSIGSSQIQRILRNPIHKAIPAQKSAAAASGDKVEISADVNAMLKALQKNDVRADKVAEIRQAIARGAYEDDHKLNVALDRLLDDVLG